MEVQEEQKWLEAINRTGFDLEYKVQRILRKHNWHVVNNRYYIDDKTGADREIDIVAYKTRYKENVIFYTYLIISCKKSNESSWVFLTSDNDKFDEDFDMCPIEMAFSDSVLQAILDKEKPIAVKRLNEINSLSKICDAPHRVLAFQQINKKSYKNEDDKRIFSSIITTIKAAAYERNYILSKRQPSIELCLNFNLLSIFEGGLKENYRNETQSEVKDIQEIKYINRHIIDDTDRSYRVHFISDVAFESLLEQYDQAAEDIVDYYLSLYKEVYDGIFCDEKRYRIDKIWTSFTSELISEMYNKTDGMDEQEYYSASWITKFEYRHMEKQLILYWDFSLFIHPETIIAELNADKELKEVVTEKLKKYFRYSGELEFTLEREQLAYKSMEEE